MLKSFRCIFRKSMKSLLCISEYETFVETILLGTITKMKMLSQTKKSRTQYGKSKLYLLLLENFSSNQWSVIKLDCKLISRKKKTFAMFSRFFFSCIFQTSANGKICRWILLRHGPIIPRNASIQCHRLQQAHQGK